MRHRNILGQRLAKKALLKNAKNLQKIYDMYWEKIEYEIIYPDRKEIKKKFKYHVKDILKKFNIGSMNEIIFLFYRYYEPCKICKFCNEESHCFPLRRGTHDNDCRCIGICAKCNKPTDIFYKKNYCFECGESRERFSHECECNDNNITDRCMYKFLYMIQSDYYIKENYDSKKQINCAISILKHKLKLFNLLLEDKSHGSEISGNNARRNDLREIKDVLPS